MLGLIQSPPRISDASRESFSTAPHARTTLFGIEMDPVTMTQAVDRVMDWVGNAPTKCQIVVTPNVDHIVQLQTNAELRQAYRQSALVVADGWPVVTASRWLGKPLPERVPGSDLVPEIFRRAQTNYENGAFESARKLRVYLLGAAPGVADRAAKNVQQKWPGVEVVGTYSPPLGFEKSEPECKQILVRIQAVKPDVLVVGLGAPKQELWVAKHQDRIAAGVALCVGATIDFLAGEKRRAPAWVQALRMEWLHRLLSEPKRLAKRYWHDARVFPSLVWREFRRPSQAVS
ncbi:MAG: WecB/TagA/CpsF family glycosyltransferase [Pirellulaceae bacterium]|nr:WecB/TagA/CpsF family glycosyltransferase [Pirellulaceae bacterium]